MRATAPRSRRAEGTGPPAAIAAAAAGEAGQLPALDVADPHGVGVAEELGDLCRPRVPVRRRRRCGRRAVRQRLAATVTAIGRRGRRLVLRRSSRLRCRPGRGGRRARGAPRPKQRDYRTRPCAGGHRGEVAEDLKALPRPAPDASARRAARGAPRRWPRHPRSPGQVRRRVRRSERLGPSLVSNEWYSVRASAACSRAASGAGRCRGHRWRRKHGGVAVTLG